MGLVEVSLGVLVIIVDVAGSWVPSMVALLPMTLLMFAMAPILPVLRPPQNS